MNVTFLSLNDRGNLGARMLVAESKLLGHRASLINIGEYRHNTYEFTDKTGGPSEPVLARLLPDLAPDVVGISYRSAMAPLALKLAEVVRGVCGGVRIVAGGIGASCDPMDAAKWADVVHRGEADLDLEDTLHADRVAWVPRLMTGALCRDLDSLPFPDYEADTTWTIVNGQVTHPDGRLDNDVGAYPMLTSRGCPRRCSYCHNSTVHDLYAGQQYCRQRSVAHVMREIEQTRRRWPITLLSIYDDLFIADPAWVKSFCRQLPNVWRETGGGRPRFWCMTHPLYISNEVIAPLVVAGCEEICLGVQSGSQRILDLYGRGTTRRRILEACDVLARYANLAVKVDIISANPLETEQDIVDTMTLLQEMSKTPKWHPGLSRLTVFPGSEIGKLVTEEQCQALHNDHQDFVDGLYRAAFQPRWWPLDLGAAIRRYADFQKFRASRDWPASVDGFCDEYWQPLTTWLDEGAPG